MLLSFLVDSGRSLSLSLALNTASILLSTEANEADSSGSSANSVSSVIAMMAKMSRQKMFGDDQKNDGEAKTGQLGGAKRLTLVRGGRFSPLQGAKVEEQNTFFLN